MFVALNAAKQLVTLRDHRQAAPLLRQSFFCPACKRPVRVKNGAIMPAHFAHIGPACDASEPESAAHLTGKQWLADFGARHGYKVSLERYYPTIRQRADVVWEKLHETIVLEYQCSPLSVEKLSVRTRGYASIGLRVIWVMGPRYYAQQAKPSQVKFLQYTARDGWHQWFLLEGQLHLWQWRPQRRVIRTYTQTRTWQHQVSSQIAPARAAQKVGQQLMLREPVLMRLQALAYASKHNLAGMPWLVHERLTGLPGLQRPEWQLRVQWLLRFGDASIDGREDAAFWHDQIGALRTPLVPNAKLIATVRQQWLSLLQQSGALTQTKSGWNWVQPLQWFPDIQRKLEALAERHIG